MGWANPIELLETLPAPVFRLWAAYAALEPWRLGDEEARTYPVPPRGEALAPLLAAMQAMKAKANGV